MTMQGTVESASLAQKESAATPLDELQRIARGEIPLDEAFHLLAVHQEEQARTAAELETRETWALTAILAASEPIWNQLAQSTLRFTSERSGGPATCHLELGRFAHLAALVAPTPDEQTLIAATQPCWARVAPHPGRQSAGQIGALACSYAPITVTEAISTLGLGRILSRLEDATRMAGKALLVQAQAQAERQGRLLQVERVLGWYTDPREEARIRQAPAPARLVVALLGGSSPSRLALGAAYLGLVLILLCLLLGLF